MTERSHDPQNEQSSAVRPTARSSTSIFAQGVALAGVIALTVIITLWVSRDSAQPGVEIHIPTPAPVTFQISGEVMRPGVYSLDGDPRIDDAIDAAGGLTSDADDGRINLALHVRDGAKVVIPVIGSTGGTASPDPGGDSSGGIVLGGDATSGLIDLNTASKEQLVALPGIGDVRADSIIEWRTNNLISSVNDLLAISGIGPATVNSIRDHVTQP